MTRRFWVALVLSMPVFALEMGGHLFPALHHLVPVKISIWVQLLLATLVVLWAGRPFFERGWASLKTRNPNMFTLIAMGTGVAWIYSVVATLKRSEEHTSELQSLMRISYAVFCLIKPPQPTCKMIYSSTCYLTTPQSYTK